MFGRLPFAYSAFGVTRDSTSTSAPVIWDHNTSAPGFVLSNGGLTANSSAKTLAGDVLLRANRSSASGYFEVTVSTAGGGTVIGLTSASAATNDYVGDSNGIGYLGASGNIVHLALLATYSTYTTADIIGVCRKGNFVYFSKNGVWQNSADPSAGTGGIDVSAYASDVLWPAVSTNNTALVITANFGASAFTYAIPTGVTSWDGSQTGGTTVEPSAGHLTFGGKVSALTLALNPATGHLTYGGKVSLVSIGTSVTPSTGHQSFTGHQPAVTLTTAVAPSVAHLAFGGKVPAITRNTALSAAAGHLAFTGKTPTVTLGVNVFPSVGHLAFGGKVSTVTLTLRVSPSAGHLALSGKVPTVSVSSGLLPSTGHLAFTGKVPTLTTTLNPATGHLAFAGHVPALGLAVGSNTGHIVFAGHVPLFGGTITPLTGHIAFSGHTPTVSYGPGALGHIKVDLGGFIAKPVKVWNGSAWVTKPLKFWTGTAWRATGY